MLIVFGSINLDLIVPVATLPAPGETVLGGGLLALPGGKGANQAVAAARAGAKVILAGAVGRDAFADQALAIVRTSDIDLSYLKQSDLPTGCALITAADSGENQIAVAVGANAAAEADQIPRYLFGPNVTLLMQGEVPASANAILAARAKRTGARVILNPAPMPDDLADLPPHIDVLIVNEGEAARLGDPARCAAEMNTTVIVTLGAAGVAAYLPGGGVMLAAALPVTPVDTTGAGDCFAGVLAAKLDLGLDLMEALNWAVTAAGLSCLERGCQRAYPTQETIKNAVAQRH